MEVSSVIYRRPALLLLRLLLLTLPLLHDGGGAGGSRGGSGVNVILPESTIPPTLRPDLHEVGDPKRLLASGARGPNAGIPGGKRVGGMPLMFDYK